MPKNDREVFDYLEADPETSPQSDYLTYAIFAYEKRAWIELYKKRNSGQEPAQQDIDNWILNLTDSQFVSMRREASAFFVAAAEDYFKKRIEEEREVILSSSIIREVKAAGSFWKQLAIATLTAVIGPLILGAVIALALLYEQRIPSVSSVASKINEGIEQNPKVAVPAVPPKKNGE